MTREKGAALFGPGDGEGARVWAEPGSLAPRWDSSCWDLEFYPGKAGGSARFEPLGGGGALWW